MKKQGFGTNAVHAGQHPDPVTGAVSVPIYASSTFVFQNAEQGAARFQGKEPGYIYSRLGNPTVRALEESIAALEGGEDCRATASGMAAISTAAMAVCKSGDHILAGDALYGGTHKVFTDILKAYGVGCTLVDTSELSAVEKAIKPNTKLIYIETPSNPMMKLTDMKAVAKIAKARGITTIADNTFMSPYLQRPIEHGVDVVVHSITKSLSGHSDVLGGAIVGSKAFLKAMDPMYKNMGANLGPFEAWLTLRGIKTLHVRMQCQTKSAEKIAKWLEDHPKVEWVKYPGLKSHPQYALAKRQMDGFGSMMSFELKGGVNAGRKVMNNVHLCSLAVSLGAVETLISHPATMTHAVVPKEDRIKAGITDGLVRFSVGIEDVDDIIEDLDQALAKA
jgi:methionine-gamma-lyase